MAQRCGVAAMVAQRSVVAAAVVAMTGTGSCHQKPADPSLAPTPVTGLSDTSAASPPTGPAAAADAPRMLRGTLRREGHGHRVSIIWSAVADATGYLVEMGSASMASDLGVVTTPASERTHSWILHPGLSWVRVRARRGDISTGPSNEISLSLNGGKARLTLH